MKITAPEEYGLRVLIRIARYGGPEGLTIPQISQKEGLSHHYVAKLCRVLRMAGFIQSSRGKEGGYSLAVPAGEIMLNQVLTVLGGRLFTPGFCEEHPGLLDRCSHTTGCSVRSVWRQIQEAVDQVLDNLTLHDLLPSESIRPAGQFKVGNEQVLTPNMVDQSQSD
jgi:Rrf2 family iron-sulfur cluster assembly transcriptional regulator